MEYWQSILERANATDPVWTQYFATLKLGAVGVAQFTALKDALSSLAAVRDQEVQDVDTARQSVDFSWQELRLISLKVPKIIAGVIDSGSGLLDDLAKVYAVIPWSPDKIIKRCGLLGPVWKSADDWQLAQVPARPVSSSPRLPLCRPSCSGRPSSSQSPATATASSSGKDQPPGLSRSPRWSAIPTTSADWRMHRHRGKGSVAQGEEGEGVSRIMSQDSSSCRVWRAR